MELFFTPFLSISKLFLIAVLGYVIFRHPYFHRFYKIVLHYTIDFALVILIFNRFVYGLNWELLSNGKYLLIVGFGIIFIGFIIGYFIIRIFNIAENKKYLFIAIMGFANSGYLPLPLAEALFQGQDMILAHIYIFFITIPFTVSIWSFGVPLILNEKLKINKFHFRLTTPFVALVVSMILALFNIKAVIPLSVKKGLDLISLTLSPAIMLMLGGAFSNFNLKHIKFSKDVFLTILFKLIIYPSLALIGLSFLDLNNILKIVLLIEFAVPPAVNLAIINKRYSTLKTNDNLCYLLSNLVFTYIACIITLPFMLTLYKLMN